MSVDFYVASEQWPAAPAMQKCLAQHGYPVKLKRFPVARDGEIVGDGILAEVDGQDAYLEGEVYPPAVGLTGENAEDRTADVGMMNERLAQFPSEPFRVSPKHYLVSIRIGGSPAEFSATAYIVAGLVNCFGAFAYEPQGDTYGRKVFADGLIAQAQIMKSYVGNHASK
ncbi:hypothetical protein KX816_15585 [Sphingosinicellaceae bacterium]|nr:hypothetical protein KX816_15585 [Sphingosinicellaceae bacterium]